MDFLFWFTSHEEHTTFLVNRASEDEAIDRLVEHCGGTMPESFSTERADYVRDIEDGNILVLTPTNITDAGVTKSKMVDPMIELHCQVCGVDITVHRDEPSCPICGNDRPADRE